MSFSERVMERAKADKRTIVLAEGGRRPRGAGAVSLPGKGLPT